MNLFCNCCDGIYSSFDVHFTSLCDNKCKHCIDMRFSGLGVKRPDPWKICHTILDNKDGVDDVLFLGGEPCLFLDELIYCCQLIKDWTDMKVFVTTSVPKVCYNRQGTFEDLLKIVDGINLSVQHNDECIADEIRGTKSKYDRQSFYSSLPFKEKIRVNLNIVKPHLCTREQITECISHYDKMGFNSIKLSEIQHGDEYFTSFCKEFDLKLPSPYSGGCQTYLNVQEIFNGIKTPVLLKRSCFLCESTLSASLADGLKLLSKFFIRKKKNKYGVIYGNGELKGGWV